MVVAIIQTFVVGSETRMHLETECLTIVQGHPRSDLPRMEIMTTMKSNTFHGCLK